MGEGTDCRTIIRFLNFLCGGTIIGCSIFKLVSTAALGIF